VESIQYFAGKFFGLNILARLFQGGRLQVISYDRFSGLIWNFFRSGSQPQLRRQRATVEKIVARAAIR